MTFLEFNNNLIQVNENLLSIKRVDNTIVIKQISDEKTLLFNNEEEALNAYNKIITSLTNRSSNNVISL